MMKPILFVAAFLTQTVCLEDTTVKFEIWDTAGQENILAAINSNNESSVVPMCVLNHYFFLYVGV
jgi:GTPase SAR1 family protein